MSITINPSGPGTSASPDPDVAIPTMRPAPTGPAPGLELLGVPDGSGRQAAPGLVRREDGQVIQLTPLLYRVLAELDGERGDDAVASRVSAQTDVELEADDVRYLLEERLRPIGVLDGAAPQTTVRANPLLALRWRFVVTDPDRTRRITAPFAALFHPVIVAAVLGAFVGSAGWLAVHHGLAQAARQAVYQPGWLLSILLLTLLSAGFHEFGHAAAVRYAGGTPGAMGVGLYLLWPAFYTDVTDTYRMPRRDRLRVDLGGLYFNAVFGVAVMLLWAATGTEALLLLFAGQILQMARQLLPFLRYDGYHVLADLTGVPDLFQQMGPTLSSLRPRNWGRPSPSRLRRGARITVLVWTLVTVPLLAALLLGLLLSLPRILATSADSAVVLTTSLRTALATGEPAAAALDLVQLIALGLVPTGAAYLLWRTGRQAWVLTRERTSGRPLLRTGAFALLACLLALVGWALAPDDDWTPLRAGDRGRLGDVLTAADAEPSTAVPAIPGPSHPARTVGHAQHAQLADATTPANAGGTSGADGTAPVAPVPQPPTPAVDEQDRDQVEAETPAPDDASSPEPVQHTEEQTPETAPAPTTSTDPAPQEPAPPSRTPFAERSFVTALPQPWPFLFSQPTSSRPIDNVNIAAVSDDGTSMRAFSTELVVAAPGTVDHRNEAFAFAQCTDCGAAAASFQVVLLPAEHRVIVPRNLAGAVNDHCTQCDVTAVANQLVVSVTEQPSAAVLAQIQGVLDGLAPLEQQLGTIAPGELRNHFFDAQRAVLRILAEADPTATATPEFQTEAAVADDDGVTTDRSGSDGVQTTTLDTAPTTPDESEPAPEAPSPEATPAVGDDGDDDGEPITADEPTPAPAPTEQTAVDEQVAVEPEELEVGDEPTTDDAGAASPPPGQDTTASSTSDPSTSAAESEPDVPTEPPSEDQPVTPPSGGDEQDLLAREEDLADTGA